jgi:phosphate regulon transcriptional regulator PhoB
MEGMSMPANILLVEDEPAIQELIAANLTRAGHHVVRAADAETAQRIVREALPDLVLLDWMLPGASGIEFARRLRADERTRNIPIIMLTARGEEADRVRGLELGADDYVTKPFSPKELVARVGALLRRAQRPAGSPKALRYGPLSMDLDRHQVLLDDREIRLTAKEFLLLQYFIEHSGRVLSRDLLLTDVWGYQYTGGTRTVDVHVRRLREKIPLFATSLTTVKQFGYKLEDAPRPMP